MSFFRKQYFESKIQLFKNSQQGQLLFNMAQSPFFEERKAIDDLDIFL